MNEKSLFDIRLHDESFCHSAITNGDQSNVVVELMNQLLLVVSSSLFPFYCRSIHNRVHCSIPLIQL